MALEDRLLAVWYGQRAPSWWMVAGSWLYAALAGLRKAGYRSGLLRTRHPGVPVIVVGNITAGGTGKTPLVISLVEHLAAAGLKPAVVSRGYGGNTDGVHRVGPDDTPAQCGDEPVLIARRTSIPVWVSRDRPAAAARAVEDGAEVVVSDDGLQHLALGRDIEIAVVDGQRRLGNRRLMPAGPLREPAQRLETVDYVIFNGGPDHPVMALVPEGLRTVADDNPGPAVEDLGADPVHAVAAIGHPRRFFQTLKDLGIPDLVEHAFPDHHDFEAGDLAHLEDEVVVMTEKDAVKCRALAGPRWYGLPVMARLPEGLLDEIVAKVVGLRESRHG